MSKNINHLENTESENDSKITENSTDSMDSNFDSDIESPEDFEEDFKKGRIIHIIFLLFIIVIIGVAAYQLYKWNKGVASDFDPTADTSEYNTESEDFILELGPSALEGYVDDGITTILCLGDDYFAQGKGTDSIPDLIEEDIEGSVVINGSFNGSTLSTIVNLDTGYSPDTPLDAFTPYWIINAMVLENFTLMNYSMDLDTLTTKDEDYAATIDTLETVDLENVDVIVLMYGMNDYLNNRLVTDVNDLSAIYSYSGAFQSVVDLIQTNYPHIRIIFSSPSISFTTDENGETVNTNLYNNGYNTLPGYSMAVKATALGCSYVSFVDNYYGFQINQDNYQDYLTDNWHLNLDGRKVIADKLASIIDGSYGNN